MIHVWYLECVLCGILWFVSMYVCSMCVELCGEFAVYVSVCICACVSVMGEVNA